jgi:hypothetical protein
MPTSGYAQITHCVSYIFKAKDFKENIINQWFLTCGPCTSRGSLDHRLRTTGVCCFIEIFSFEDVWNTLGNLSMSRGGLWTDCIGSVNLDGKKITPLFSLTSD